MEKKSPHYKLSLVQGLASAGMWSVTVSAWREMKILRFSDDELRQVILALTPKDFYKSMTSHADHRVWQDVYRPQTRFGRAYLKLTVIDRLLVISFKEL